MQVPPYHSAEEMRAISDLVHQVEGLIVAATALLVLGEAGRLLRNRLLWPGTVCRPAFSCLRPCWFRITARSTRAHSGSSYSGIRSSASTWESLRS